MRLFQRYIGVLTLLALLGGCGTSSQAPTDDLSQNKETQTQGPLIENGCDLNGLPYGAGTGTPSDPYLICSIAQINQMILGADSEKHFRLNKDIDASGVNLFSIPEIAGTFEGNNKTIRNWNGYGPFIETLSGTVKNLSLESVTLTGGYRLGLVGTVESTGTVDNCQIQGTLVSPFMAGGIAGLNLGIIRGSSASINLTGVDTLGGLVGQNQGTIESSSAAGSITLNPTGTASVPSLRGNLFGGLVGRNQIGTISLSSAAVTISGIGRLGGLVGDILAGSISRSYATGNVSGSGNRVGGLVGYAGAVAIANSYAQGSAQGNTEIGGLVGYSEASIANSYSVGPVLGVSSTGGLVGNNAGGSASNSFWNTQTSGQASSAAGTGQTTAQLQTTATFGAWDSSTVWLLASGQYPTLR